ncbi:MAG: DUF58 domain-containing protein [Gemmatimonadales bacterium]
MYPRWFDPALADELRGVPLPARRVNAGRGDGRHASRLPGSGVEFAQFRGYQPGDDPRRVDWKLLARSDRFYVRQADAETALPLRLLLDTSRSMAHTEGGRSKFDAARQLVATLALLAIRQGDTPSLHLLPGTSVAPSRDSRQFERILHALDGATPAGALPADIERELAATDGAGHGFLLAVTDAHDPEHRLLHAVERSGEDAAFLVLRTEREHDLAYGRSVLLEDLESGATLTIDPDTLHARTAAYARHRDAAMRLGVDWVAIDPGAPMMRPLREWLAQRAGRR